MESSEACPARDRNASGLDSKQAMRELRREIDIDAPPPAVWAVLTDIRSYSEWNPFMPHLAGELREGAKLEVRIEPPADGR
jgi:uncharacterized protein YndB with AHSA1/START domain